MSHPQNRSTFSGTFKNRCGGGGQGEGREGGGGGEAEEGKYRILFVKIALL